MSIAGPALMMPEENIYGHRKKLKFFLDQLDSIASECGPTLRILDFGCGNGTAIGQHIVAKGYEYYGVDLHDDSLKYASTIITGENAYFSNAVPENVNFDAILYGDVLEHLELPEATVLAHFNLLTPHGRMIGAVPNGNGPFEIESALDRRYGLTAKFQEMRRCYYAYRHVLAVWVKCNILGQDLPMPPPLSEPVPFNVDSPHIQFFRWPDIATMFESCGMTVTEFRKGVFIGAPFTGSIFGGCPTLLRLNCDIADKVPARMVSNWYFVARKIGE